MALGVLMIMQSILTQKTNIDLLSQAHMFSSNQFWFSFNEHMFRGDSRMRFCEIHAISRPISHKKYTCATQKLRKPHLRRVVHCRARDGIRLLWTSRKGKNSPDRKSKSQTAGEWQKHACCSTFSFILWRKMPISVKVRARNASLASNVTKTIMCQTSIGIHWFRQ